MGCSSSILWSCAGGRARGKKPGRISEVAVFAPPLRAPVAVDFARPLKGLVAPEIAERLGSLRRRISLLARENDLVDLAGISELRRAVEEYLPMLLGLTKKELRLEALVEFRWKSLGDSGQETCLASASYELLSVIHMAAVLLLLEANLKLVCNISPEACEDSISDDSRRAVIDLLLQAAGCLDYCIHHIYPRLPSHVRNGLPKDLQEGVLGAISIQALAQAVEMQLGFALESEKATMSVKRRLACEAVCYFSHAHCCLSGCDSEDVYAKKLLFFLQYKYLEAKAAAYYFHGLITGKGNSQDDRISSVCCHLAADEILVESRKACLSFGLAPPISRVLPVWGAVKLLHRKIPEAASRKSQSYASLLDQDKSAFQALPDLPEFPLSLKPVEFEPPELDDVWSSENRLPPAQCLKEHLQDDDGGGGEPELSRVR